MTALAQKFSIRYLKMSYLIAGVAITQFVMQTLFTVQKEKLLPTEHGLVVCLTMLTHSKLNLVPFLNFSQKSLSILFSTLVVFLSEITFVVLRLVCAIVRIMFFNCRIR